MSTALAVVCPMLLTHAITDKWEYYIKYGLEATIIEREEDFKKSQIGLSLDRTVDELSIKNQEVFPVIISGGYASSYQSLRYAIYLIIL